MAYTSQNARMYDDRVVAWISINLARRSGAISPARENILAQHGYYVRASGP
jgi:hypothetical protein